MSAWIPFHSSLREGDKRGLPRAVRFVYLELSLLSRPTGGRIALPRGFKTDIDAIHDILGGDRREIRTAIELLTAPFDPSDPSDEPMLRLSGPPERRILELPAHTRWVRPDTTADRVRRHRNRRPEQSHTDTGRCNADQPVTVTPPPVTTVTVQRRGEEREEREQSKRIPTESGVVTTKPSSWSGSDVANRAPSSRLIDLGSARCEEACQVFVEAVGEAGWDRPPLRERWERQALCDTVNTHLRANGTIAAVLAALREAVREWTDDVSQVAERTSGWSPRKFGEWLSVQRKRQPAPSSSRLPPLPPEDAAEPMTSAERAETERYLSTIGLSETVRMAREDDRNHVVPNFPAIAWPEGEPKAS